MLGLQLQNHRKSKVSSISRQISLSTMKMKLFDRFRKSLMRFIFFIPSSKGSQTTPSASSSSSSSAPRRKSCDKPDPPKTSCSSYYSSNSHHSEAVADCIEFLNKSHQGFFSGRKSDFIV
ncbi:hypothetical protein ACH5RR_035233 [Cinchona calisaya]|uniref:Josephin-like protein n=1 Tax=Cinchona calisaya TaxID=153742 RepID=A0ABD2YD88_9GENT